jgi:hypothetical protein
MMIATIAMLLAPLLMLLPAATVEHVVAHAADVSAQLAQRVLK